MKSSLPTPQTVITHIVNGTHIETVPFVDQPVTHQLITETIRKEHLVFFEMDDTWRDFLCGYRHDANVYVRKRDAHHCYPAFLARGHVITDSNVILKLAYQTPPMQMLFSFHAKVVGMDRNGSDRDPIVYAFKAKSGVRFSIQASNSVYRETDIFMNHCYVFLCTVWPVQNEIVSIRPLFCTTTQTYYDGRNYYK